MMMSVINLALPVLLAAQATGVATAEVVDDVDQLVQEDPYGLIMAFLGMTIVFFALFLIYFIFTKTRALFTSSFKHKMNNLLKFGKDEKKEEVVKVSSKDELSGEVNAAIAAAIHLYRSELHDFEDAILTIKKVSRTYSPWSSKIYGLRDPLAK